MVPGHDLRVLGKGLRDAVCEEMPHYFGYLFPPESKTPDMPESGAAEARTVDGHRAYDVTSGMHGYDALHIFVDLGTGRTGVLSFYTIGSYLMGALPARNAKVAEQQLEIVERMLVSVHFTGG